VAEIKKCTVGDQGELSIIYHVKGNAIWLNMAEGTSTELFREQLAPASEEWPSGWLAGDLGFQVDCVRFNSQAKQRRASI
jgi:hypothetical protein